jgi:hypothetical protein
MAFRSSYILYIDKDCVSVSRSLVSKLRRLEKETHLLQRALAEDPMNEELMIEMDDLEQQVGAHFTASYSVNLLLVWCDSSHLQARKFTLDLDMHVSCSHPP